MKIDDDDTIDAAVGLLKYRIKKEGSLKYAAGAPPNQTNFREALEPKGVPPIVCDILFEEYLAPTRKKTVTLRMTDKSDKSLEVSADNRTLVCLEEVAREQFSIAEAKLGFFLAPPEQQAPKTRIDSDEKVAALEDGSVVKVVNEQKGFSKVTNIKKALSMWGFEGQELKHDDAAFEEFDDPKQLKMSLDNNHIKHALATITGLLGLVDLVDGCETTHRLYIDPVLVAAGFMAKDLKLKVEQNVNSPEAKGPVDYMFYYNLICVCVSEGKKDQLDKGIAQNVAQLGAIRANRKRKHDHISPSDCYGIATTFTHWVFIKINDNEAVRSKWYVVDESKPETVKDMIARVVLLLQRCKQDVNDSVSKTKRRK